MSESNPPTPPPVTPPLPPAAAPVTYVQMPAEPRKRSGVRTFFRVVFWMVLASSIMTNLFLMGLLAQTLADEAEMSRVVLDEGNAKQTVAVYRVAGLLDHGAVTAFREFCDEVAADKDVRAIVLRVNSPGGGVASSNQIHQMVKALQSAGKPIVVSMGAMAASGGYMISCSADRIIAEPTTVTGSIGVIMSWLVLEGTLDKIGVEPVVIKSTDADYWKDDVSLMHLPDERQVAYLRDILDEMQAQFAASVRAGRGDKLPEPPDAPPAADGAMLVEFDPDANEPLNGKVYLAGEAMRLGLIDEIGYRHDAIDRAAKLAGLDDPHVVAYRHRPPGLLKVLFGAERQGAVSEGIDLVEDLQTPKFEAKWLAP